MVLTGTAISRAKGFDQWRGGSGCGKQAEQNRCEHADSKREELYRHVESDGLEQRFVKALGMSQRHAE